MKALIVDDSQMTRNLHGFILESAGFEIILAENGSEALEKLLAQNIDLVVTDINMPQMDGLELIRRIRCLADYLKTPIIIISTESEALDKSRGFEAGANLYVIKPAQAAELILNTKMLLGTQHT